MAGVQESIAITSEQEAASKHFFTEVLWTLEHGLQVWLDQTVETRAGPMRPLDADDARLQMPAAGFGFAITLHSKSPVPVVLASHDLVARVVTAAEGRPAEEGELAVPSLESDREDILGLGSFFAAGLFDRGLQRTEDERIDADVVALELADSSWIGADDPLLGSERFFVFEGEIAVGLAGFQSFQVFLPWGYAASLFQYTGKASGTAASADPAAPPKDAAGHSSSARFPSEEETMSIAALVKREPPPPPPTGAPPRISLKDLHRFRPKRQLPIRYMRGHQMRETRELSPIYVVGSRALMPVLTSAYQDREVFHMDDGRELAKRLDGAALPAAVIVHCPQGHEPWVTGWVGATKFRENLDRQPVVVILDDASPENVLLCGRMGLINVFSSETEPDQVLSLLAPHLD